MVVIADKSLQTLELNKNWTLNSILLQNLKVQQLIIRNSDLNFIEFRNLEVQNTEATQNSGKDDYLDDLIRLQVNKTTDVELAVQEPV